MNIIGSVSITPEVQRRWRQTAQKFFLDCRAQGIEIQPGIEEFHAIEDGSAQIVCQVNDWLQCVMRVEPGEWTHAN